ncbi:DnaJ-domain-containing protein [Suhomyces tanzawaensis NRRL Y-17324]|uniref:DnaJ-domain-containing protein n=1 Tax=Suhomyces tanzawaensis NRRL Y-17324 TaxID=984487 RepID=A0A1E4SIY7_9ASCO|nr:DnaJ-domain-containing protein [Suhomyces tanzawaensis NRRL Y-17324]ODV79464.1 DnaJ-domain-containing protein [Suhomyces tanzawaensis NRRL Y-17324]
MLTRSSRQNPNCFLRLTRCYATAADESINHYERLGIAPNASIKEIKMQFKKLSKKFHPDLNAHLSPEEKEANSSKFVKIVQAYDILKDVKRKKQYDHELRVAGGLPMQSMHNQRRSPASEWHNKYYGEAKYYSRSRSTHDTYTASGLNTKRHHVHYGEGYDGSAQSKFSGEHKNYGDRFDVPHFDYNQHLLRNLKFEQRMITRNISDDQRNKILSQLSKLGEKLSEELITKHLMRHVHNRDSEPSSHSNHSKGRAETYQATSSFSNPNAQYMYRGPQLYEEESGSAVFKTFMVLGGAGSSLYLLYSIFH